MRADSYRALRLLGLALTSWTSHWAAGAGLRQRGAALAAARRRRLLAAVVGAWAAEAERLRVKRQHAEM